VIELRCSYDPDTLGANPQGRKVRGVIHWVSAAAAVRANVHLYDRLFIHPSPDSVKEGHFLDLINPDSLRTLTGAMAEASLRDAEHGERFQFEREGYFCVDRTAADDEAIVFNRIVTLRDSWAKIEQELEQGKKG
jgi:glutaminyl-tRNA synthetase